MIELIGLEGSPEYRAAQQVRSALVHLWPKLEEAGESGLRATIAANVTLSGYPVSDVDIVLCLAFDKPMYFRATRVLKDNNGNRVTARNISVRSLIVAMEVKDHDPGSVRFVGDKVIVSYSRGGPAKFHDATEQNVKQVHSLKSYYADQHVDAFVFRAVVLPNVERSRINGVVTQTFDGNALLTAVASTAPLRKVGQQYTLQSFDVVKANRVLSAPIFRPVIPTALDRARMDRIASRSEAVEAVLLHAGNKLVTLRGVGGTGKTVALLQVGWRVWRETGKRSILLTYNHALSADIRRQMALLHIPSSVEEGGIQVQTVMSFVYAWCHRLGIIGGEDVDYDEYPRQLTEAVELFSSGAITSDDIAEVIESSPNQFDYDFILVDEGQDWPTEEIRLLKSIYSGLRLIVADGVDQLVRGRLADWRVGTPSAERVGISRTRCLRLKRNVSLFVSTLVDRLGLGWRFEPNEDAAGGRVIFLTKSYADCYDLHQRLVAECKEAGNAEIDMLFCVPPDSIRKSGQNTSCELTDALHDWGGSTWDGFDERKRRDFPRSITDFRVVQYASCRGLEGWTVVLESFDKFLAHRVEEARNEGRHVSPEMALMDVDSKAVESAWRWALIALTRPIDTLIIHLSDPHSEFSRELLTVGEMYSDFVTTNPSG